MTARRSLYDVAGRRVATLDQGAQEAGEHRVLRWTDATAPKGVYFVRLRVNGRAQPGPAIRIQE